MAFFTALGFALLVSYFLLIRRVLGFDKNDFKEEKEESVNYSDMNGSVSNLLAIIILVDDNIDIKEVEIAKKYLGEIGYPSDVLDSILENGIKLNFRVSCLALVRNKCTYTDRLSLLDVLFQIANAYEGILYTETQMLRNIARFLLIKNADLFDLEVKYGVTKKEQKKKAQTDYLHNLYIHTLLQSYKTLELESSASKDEIKHAYRRLALQYHPDKQPAEATAEEKADAGSKFRMVNEAYNYLRKERKIV